MTRKEVILILGVLCLVCFKSADSFEGLNVSEVYEEMKYGFSLPLMVGRTLISGAASKGAVCLDGSWPAYHIHRGYGSGANSWLIQLEGGGWCDTIRNCVYRKKTRHGSSYYMEKQIPFTGILSNKVSENPGMMLLCPSFSHFYDSDQHNLLIYCHIFTDFYNWNRVKIRYCDGASFTGDSENKEAQLHFRGQRIWEAAMEEMMSIGMRHAHQALLSGCSAGGLASIVHCDEFRALFPRATRVKCLSDGGLFLDATDIAGRRTMRRLLGGVVRLQGVGSHLPWSCTRHLNPILCFFPQHLIPNVKTPLFVLNAAYDAWQIQASLATAPADPHGNWHECKMNIAHCNSQQIQFLQGFRRQMLNALKGFARSRQNGLFVNSCFAHCQSERQDTWFTNDSPRVGNQGIAHSVGNWFFDRAEVKVIDCAYPCDRTCHNLVFRNLEYEEDTSDETALAIMT